MKLDIKENKRTPHEHMIATMAALEKRKQDRVNEGIRQAREHTFENIHRINKRTGRRCISQR